MPRPTAITPDDTLAYLSQKTADGDPPALGTREIAEGLDVSKQTALDRLHTLEDEGRVKRYDAGTASVWYPPDESEEIPESTVDVGDGAQADGAVGGEFEEVTTLLTTNREMVQETRLLRKEYRQLRRALTVLVFGVGIAMFQAFYSLPEALQFVGGLAFLVGFVWGGYLLLTPASPEDVEVE